MSEPIHAPQELSPQDQERLYDELERIARTLRESDPAFGIRGPQALAG